MNYFVLVSASVAPKNNLQKRVHFLVKRWHQAMTNEPYGIQPDLYRVLQDAQQRFPKCKPVTIQTSSEGFRQGMEQYTYWIGAENSDNVILSVTLYRVGPEPLPMVFSEGAVEIPKSAPLTIIAGNAMATQVWIADMSGMNDGQLLELRTSYRLMAETRAAKKEIEHLGEPFRTYPTEVWLRCIEHVDEEIKRRATTGKEVSDAGDQLD